MKKILLLQAVLVFFATSSAFAFEINSSDSGIYELLRSDNNAPTNFFYKFTFQNNKWLVSGKQPNTNQWDDVACGVDCEYGVVSEGEARRYFANIPNQGALEFSCIKNKAQAFCKYALKDDDSKVGYTFFALVTNPPRLMKARRIQ